LYPPTSPRRPVALARSGLTRGQAPHPATGGLPTCWRRPRPGV